MAHDHSYRLDERARRALTRAMALGGIVTPEMTSARTRSNESRPELHPK